MSISKKFATVAVSTALVFGAGTSCSSSSTGSDANKVKSTADCVKDYFDTASPKDVAQTGKILQRAEEFARDLGDPEAIGVADFLQKNTSTERYDDDKIEVISIKENKGYLDCPFFQQATRIGAIGVYNHEADAIVFIGKGGKSSLTNSMVALHEGAHAEHAHSDKPANPNEERDVRVFEQRLLREQLGQGYDQLVTDMETKIVEGGFNEEDGFIINSEELPRPALEAVFGKNTTNYDQTAVFVAGVFGAFEDEGHKRGISEGEIANHQQEFMASIEGGN